MKPAKVRANVLRCWEARTTGTCFLCSSTSHRSNECTGDPLPIDRAAPRRAPGVVSCAATSVAVAKFGITDAAVAVSPTVNVTPGVMADHLAMQALSQLLADVTVPALNQPLADVTIAALFQPLADVPVAALLQPLVEVFVTALHQPLAAVPVASLRQLLVDVTMTAPRHLLADLSALPDVPLCVLADVSAAHAAPYVAPHNAPGSATHPALRSAPGTSPGAQQLHVRPR